MGLKVPNTENRVLLNRREALLLSATAGVAAALPRSARASQSARATAARQGAGTLSTPRSAVARTQYGKVRGYLERDVLTFKGVPYGQDTGGENRWLPAKPPARSEEHTSELQSPLRISYAVFCLLFRSAFAAPEPVD